MHWVQFKHYLSEITGLHQDALHIYAALLIQVTAAICLRRSLASIVPWLSVLAILIANESVDLLEPGKPIEQWQVLGGLRDLWNTLALPTVLWLLARHAPSLIADRPERIGDFNPTARADS